MGKLTETQVAEVEDLCRDHIEALAGDHGYLGEGGLTFDGELKVWGHVGHGCLERLYLNVADLRRLGCAANSLAITIEMFLHSNKEG